MQAHKALKGIEFKFVKDVYFVNMHKKDLLEILADDTRDIFTRRLKIKILEGDKYKFNHLAYLAH